MEKLFFKKVELWFVLLCALVAILGALGFGAVVLHGARGGHLIPFAQAAVAVAETPTTLISMFEGDRRMTAFAAERWKGRGTGWIVPENAPKDDGYLLLSRYDGDAHRHVVSLVSLTDQSVVYEWRPDASSFLPLPPATSRIAEPTAWETAFWRVIHPYLADNGSLVIKDHQSYVYDITPCGAVAWRQESMLFHHSTESDGAGGYWIPGVIEPQTPERISDEFYEDALVRLGPDGTILETISMANVFLKHGMEYALFTAGDYQKDPMHLNDIQPVLTDGPYWKAGDLFLSFRHLSMIALFRPSTGELVWKQQGPWLAQHDVDILDDHRIAVFDNHAYDRGTGARVHGNNRIAVYDFATNEVTFPWAAALEKNDVKTLFEGLFTLLPSGNLMVEEENAGRILIMKPDGTATEYLNVGANGMAYRMGWSRYIDADTAAPVIKTLKAASCQAG